jgi:hypothetical protein
MSKFYTSRLKSTVYSCIKAHRGPAGFAAAFKKPNLTLIDTYLLTELGL